MEAGTIAPGASAEEQERQRKMAEEAEPDGGAVEHDKKADGDFKPDAEPTPDAEAEILSLEIEGDGQLTLTVGGAKPETSSITLIGGKMDVSGGDFDKGQEVKLLIHGVVAAVTFEDSRDQYGNISGTERKHKVRPLRVERLKD